MSSLHEHVHNKNTSQNKIVQDDNYDSWGNHKSSPEDPLILCTSKHTNITSSQVSLISLEGGFIIDWIPNSFIRASPGYPLPLSTLTVKPFTTIRGMTWELYIRRWKWNELMFANLRPFKSLDVQYFKVRSQVPAYQGEDLGKNIHNTIMNSLLFPELNTHTHTHTICRPSNFICDQRLRWKSSSNSCIRSLALTVSLVTCACTHITLR